MFKVLQIYFRKRTTVVSRKYFKDLCCHLLFSGVLFSDIARIHHKAVVFMKKVRFESPNKLYVFKMNESECHSPRPFMERESSAPPVFIPELPRVLTYTNDPVQRYENSNSSPYPVIGRTELNGLNKEPCWKPSEDLNISLLDASSHEPRNPGFCKSILKENIPNTNYGVNSHVNEERLQLTSEATSSNKNEPPNVLVKDNSFFIKRDNLGKYNFNANPLHNQISKLNLGKENDPLAKKFEMMNVGHDKLKNTVPAISPVSTPSEDCRCFNCVQSFRCLNVNNYHHHHAPVLKEIQTHQQQLQRSEQNCVCSTPRGNTCHPCHIPPPAPKNICKTCNCHNPDISSPAPQNAVDRKTWAIQKYEESQQPCMEVEKQKKLKEKREPTVADLFKIIKLQNEQLQLLQEKVDKFLSNQQNIQPTITCSTEQVSVNTVGNNDGKMSVGVMTSFEMIRTSTVINKEVVTQNTEAQIHCNRSQISIKEVSKPVNMNFLDGIVPKNAEQNKDQGVNNGKYTENACDEKTYNEQSLYNVQVDNATTPMISPEQTLYLDVRDYSDSDASSNDQSNVGWTYYNKVMTHVNGMLQDSEMPSSASAMYRNTRQQCLMQIDTTNVSVTKRVKFGDDPLGLHQLLAPTTDTSLKMNQLAAKYLQTGPRVRPAVSTQAHIDMSLATRNYMEKHRILQGLPAPSKSPQAGELPKFLDITALKQQPKFL